jgi:enoyl-CoA hydratase/carnithine racemase
LKLSAARCGESAKANQNQEDVMSSFNDRPGLAAGGTEVFPEGLALARDSGVLTLTIDRMQDLNRLSPEVIARLAAITELLREDADTNVLVITGAGSELFSMGLLNPAIRASCSKDDVVRLIRRANAVFDAIEALPQIVVAAINGKVVAGAAELCFACDLRYAASHATLVMPEAAWGGFPGAGAPVRLPLLIGRARALELICTGREVNAAEMERLGLVQAVYPSAEFSRAIAETVRSIAAGGPLAIRGAKRIMAARQDPGFRAARELSDALRHELEWSQDVDEGMAAHRENRKPKFRGR